MKILIVADEEYMGYSDYYVPGRLKPYQLILSGGDLKADYLSFMVTMARCPLMYVHGNHDDNYEENPPEGCDSIDDKLVVYRGLRILGLGGSSPYCRGKFQYTEKQMRKRIRKLKKAIEMVGGVDVVLSHAAPRGVGDWDDPSHQGFEAFLELIDTYHPKYLFHGHVHLSYGHNIQRVREYHGTKVINCCERFELDYEFPLEYQPLPKIKRLYCRLFLKNLQILNY